MTNMHECEEGFAPGGFITSFDRLSVQQLLQAYGAVLDELRRREVVRSLNSPISDYAEILFCKAFGWTREGNSASGHDATDERGVRYQIKARRLTQHSTSRQMSAIRNLDRDPFDYLAGLLVDDAFNVLRAAVIPVAVVRQRSAHVVHTNSWRFLLRDDVWAEPGVRDVTADIRSAATLI